MPARVTAATPGGNQCRNRPVEEHETAVPDVTLSCCGRAGGGGLMVLTPHCGKEMSGSKRSATFPFESKLGEERCSGRLLAAPRHSRGTPIRRGGPTAGLRRGDQPVGDGCRGRDNEAPGADR